METLQDSIRRANVATQRPPPKSSRNTPPLASQFMATSVVAFTPENSRTRKMSSGTSGDEPCSEQRARGVLAELYPLPTWHVVPPGDVFRVFERGGRNINTQFAEVGLPNPTGIIQRLEEPGRPDLRQSNRGPGTGLRVSIPVLNIHKTRLNDPYMWFMGTNDQPGDYRHSGCAGCHVVYANDREPRHSLTYAQYGRDGQTATVDPTIARLTQRLPTQEAHFGDEDALHEDEGQHANGHEAPVDGNHYAMRERGHPVRHVFTRAIPTAQCMNCHMHQPNIFLNSYLGYTMWDYESDADLMWPGPENRLPRPEGMDEGVVVMTGLNPERILQAVDLTVAQFSEVGSSRIPPDYDVGRVSWKVAKIILSYTDYVNRRVWRRSDP